ncbi:MAG TPA: aldehyde dehydrogenase family protein [Polyangia bacterium]|nr:aldehyde dehydrogenase family protein [Polyangia bacterium]
MTTAPKVTYVSLSADDPEIDAGFQTAIAEARATLGRTHPARVAGQDRPGDGAIDSRNPADARQVVARVASASAADLRDAVAAARAAYPAWSARPWQERVAIIERAGEIVRARRFELSVWMILEMGKNRVEALGEIEETADLLAYYAGQMRENHGYVREMGRLAPTDQNTSVLRPYGVWAVIAPWNFPYALLGAPVAAALVTGNTVVCKPSSETPLSALKLTEIFEAAGVPAGALSCLPGSGRVIGDGLVEHPDVDGVTFTGSYDVGFKRIYQRFAGAFPKPAIVEMGGKNPAIVMPSADLAQAAQGIYRSAFGMNGHKCSACSRVYVHRDVADRLLAELARLADAVNPADPLDKGVFVGPVATKASYEDYQRYIEMARAAGPNVVRAGGAVLADGARAHGYFVRPTVLAGLSRGHQLLTDELFVPIVAVESVGSMAEALERANDTKFGLTAGCFSRDHREIDAFFDGIQAGVVYVNRAAGATTGAWPGVQPFGGWKGSGSTGKNIGGLYTLPCYLREQSRTVCA